MRELIHLLPAPSHYAGIEDGAVRKDPEKVSLHIALAFPDVYVVGMSYLGQKILYGIVNSRADWWAERVMEPDAEACAILRARNAPLCTLESDTPLASLDAVCFSVTHELCATDILNMLDLARIPLRTAERPDDLGACPLVIAGGGAMLGAEPLAPFFDLVELGDGEELLPEILELLQSARQNGWGRREFLRAASRIPGVYVPSLFRELPDGSHEALVPGYIPRRRIVADLDKASYPHKQVAPVGAIHNRLSLEIGRGCGRGCRFCHAGMVYRPCRERKPETVANLLSRCLEETGYDEVSFLALSAGDCTALKRIYLDAHARCRKEQTSLALPSLRVGSVDDEIMASMADLHRPGATLAPEAGSQRLRDVINKGISEEDLIRHARKLIEHGWRQVKLYFMIGLPTETDADLEAIPDLCRKTRDAAGRGGLRLQITAAISPFVPKPFTPFQWEAQIDLAETERRIAYLRDLFQREKGLKLRWHEPASSFLEGILSRGDRRLADVIELAFRKGALFCAWHEHFRLEPWLEALSECGLAADSYLVERNTDSRLPWEHFSAGVSREFLLRERARAYAAKITPDCRFGPCGQCGACDHPNQPSSLHGGGEARHRLVFAQRDQTDSPAFEEGNLRQHERARPKVEPGLVRRAIQYRLWHRKDQGAEFLSQLELQAVLSRAFRRAKAPVAFSQGYHPMPLVSFGRALPVGCASSTEWFSVVLHSWMDANQLAASLNACLPEGLRIFAVKKETGKPAQAISEIFSVELAGEGGLEFLADKFSAFSGRDSFLFTRQTPKGEKTADIRPCLLNWRLEAGALRFATDWSEHYISPLLLARAISGADLEGMRVRKIRQVFADGSESP